MYQGSLDSFYIRYPSSEELSYEDHNKLLINDTTEFAGSYTRTLRRLGIEVNCVITNDLRLQKKWEQEKDLKIRHPEEVLMHQISSFKPDVLWIENMTGIGPDFIKSIRSRINTIRLIVAYHCSPYNQTLLQKLKSVDFLITCTPGLKLAFENEGIASYLVYHGFDNDLLLRLADKPDSKKIDLVFSGSLTTGGLLHNERIFLIERLLKERIELELFINIEKPLKIKIKQSIYFLTNLLKRLRLEKLADKIPFSEYGKTPVQNYSETLLSSYHDPLFGLNMYELFCNSKIVLNNHVGVAGNYAGNMRLFEVTGVGSCLLTDNKKNIGDLFDPQGEVVVYSSPEDCIEKVKWLLENEEQRKTIALAGHQKTLRSHTVENRCKSIISIIESELRSR
jgi:spore maturation protein CgeB